MADSSRCSDCIITAYIAEETSLTRLVSFMINRSCKCYLIEDLSLGAMLLHHRRYPARLQRLQHPRFRRYQRRPH